MMYIMMSLRCSCCGCSYLIVHTHVTSHLFFFFFFNDTATTEIYTLSLHDALPISGAPVMKLSIPTTRWPCASNRSHRCDPRNPAARSEEHTSELQSPCNLVCRLLLEKKKHRSPQHLLRHMPALHLRWRWHDVHHDVSALFVLWL